MSCENANNENKLNMSYDVIIEHAKTELKPEITPVMKVRSPLATRLDNAQRRRSKHIEEVKEKAQTAAKGETFKSDIEQVKAKAILENQISRIETYEKNRQKKLDEIKEKAKVDTEKVLQKKTELELQQQAVWKKKVEIDSLIERKTSVESVKLAASKELEKVRIGQEKKLKAEAAEAQLLTEKRLKEKNAEIKHKLYLEQVRAKAVKTTGSPVAAPRTEQRKVKTAETMVRKLSIAGENKEAALAEIVKKQQLIEEKRQQVLKKKQERIETEQD